MSLVPARIALLLILPLPAVAEPGPAPHEYRTDRNGDPLPPGAVARLGVAPALSGFAWALGWTADAHRFVTVDYGGVTVFDAATGRRVETQAIGTEGRSLYTPLSRDGRLLFLLNGRTGVLYDTATTDCRTFNLPEPFGDPERKVYSLNLSGDCRFLAGVSGSGTIPGVAWRFDLARGLFTRILLDRADLHSVRLSPDGKRVFATSGVADPELTARDLVTNKNLWTVRLKGIGVLRTVSADGRRLAVADSDGVRVFDAVGGKSVMNAAVDSTTPTNMWGVDLSPDGSWLAVAVDRQVTVWDVNTGQVKQRLPHAARLVAFSPDGRSLLTISAWAQRWDVETGKAVYPAPILDRPLAASRLRWSADGKRLMTLWPGDRRGDRAEWTPDVLAVWDVGQMQPVWRTTSELAISDAGLDSKGVAVLAARSDQKLHCWSLSPTIPEADREQKLPPFDVAEQFEGFLPDGRFVVQKLGQSVCTDVYSSRGEHASRTTIPFPAQATHRASLPMQPGILLYPDGKRLDLLAGRPAPPLVAGPFALHGIPLLGGSALIASSVKITGAWGGPLVEGVIWDAITGGEVLRLLPRIPDWSLAVLSPDGRWLAYVNRDALEVIDLAILLSTGQPGPERSMALHVRVSETKALAFSPDGHRLATSHADGTVLIWAMPATDRHRADDEKAADWDALASALEPKVWSALWAMLDDPTVAIEILSKHLKPVEALPDTAEQIAKLDHPRFAIREAAAKELAARGTLIEGDMRTAWQKSTSAEQRERLEALLNRLDPTVPPAGEMLRSLRAVWLLERIGMPEAVKQLEKIAGGAAGSRVTAEAKAAVGRLK
jgi:WD40 repeat protein